MENTARGVLTRAAAAAHAAVPAVADAEAAGARRSSPRRRGSRWRSARAASTTRRPYAILDLWVKHDGNALAVPPSDPASMPSLLKTPTAANLIRVFRLQERLKSLGKEGEFKAAHVHVVGAGTMGGDIAAWCALRGLTVTLQDQNAERLAPAMGRAAKLFAQRLKDPRRVRDATDRLIPDVAGDGVARADVIIEAIFENLEAKRSLFAALEAKAKPGAILATNTSSHSARGHRDGDARSGAAHRHPLLQSGAADDAGRDRRRRATRARTSCRAPRRSSARSTSCRCR